MKKRFLIVAAAVLLPLSAAALLWWPLVSVVEFEAKGYFGDERIRVTRNWGSATLLADARTGTEWRTYSFEILGPLHDIRIHYLGRPHPSDPPGMLYIHNGIVKLHRKNLLGHTVSRKDILNIESTYHGPKGGSWFKEDSAQMATVRGGITGWAGYYELYP